jgi:hypothetical protein
MAALSRFSDHFGMTVNNLISIIGLVILLFGFFIDFRIQVANIDAKIQEVDLKYQLKNEELMRMNEVNTYNIEQGRKENREEHQIILNAINSLRKR